MILSMTSPATLRRLALAAALTGSILGSGPIGALAAEPNVGAAESGAAGRRLDLSVGRSVVVELARDAKEIFVANPAIANAVVRSTRKLFLLGVANGTTSVFVMDAEGRQIASLEVNVGRDLSTLRQTLRTVLPNGKIDIKPAGDSILLTGTVTSAQDAQQAVDIAKAFVGQAAAPTGTAAGFSGAVINGLTIAGREQVMLRVSVIEVARSVVKQLGINIGGNWNILNTAGAFVNPGSTLTNVATGIVGALSGASGTSIQGQAKIGGNSTVGGTLTALERAGVSRVLAEPTLVAQSGESATFLVGGEIPISIGCGSAICTPTILYKQYGIQLSFTPVVLSEGRISLRVSTEVSEIDRENAVGDTPGFRTRKTATSIELPSGATLMSAGLISSTSANTIQGTPGLINVPILGALFRSRDYQRRESELMIMVTPYIAKPMEAAQVKRPDDGFVDAADGQSIFMGRVNKLYGNAGPSGAAPAGGRNGRFGFITD